MGGVSDEDVKNLKELFYQCDSDGDGGINIIEFDVTLQYLHQSLSMEQLKMLFMDVDLDNNGKISFSEFCILMGVDSEMSVEREVADHDSIVEKSFKIFDTDNNSIISLDEVDQMMQFLGLRHTKLELTNLMNSFDVDDSGTLDLLEYQDLLTKAADAHSEEQSKLKRKFSQIDKDNNGLLSFSELYFEMSRGVEDVYPLQVQALFDSVDVDKNRQLDFEEFVKLTK